MLSEEMAAVPGVSPNRRLRNALLLLTLVTLGGAAGFVIIEGWDFWRALFFTLITITTVGYGDEGISDAGKKFASILLVGGIGVASYTFALIVQTAVTSQFAWRKKMQKHIDQLAKHTLVCGFGRMGREVSNQLATMNIPFVVIDRDPKAFFEACELGYLAVEGAASEDEVLEKAGIASAAHVVCLVPSAAENIVITLSARELRRDIPIISRAERNEEVKKLRLAGATRIVSPYKSGGLEIANAIVRPTVADFIARSQLADSDVAFSDFVIGDRSPLVGRLLAEVGKSEGTRLSFVAMERPGEAAMIPPSGALALEAGDHLIVAGDPLQIDALRELAEGRSKAA